MGNSTFQPVRSTRAQRIGTTFRSTSDTSIAGGLDGTYVDATNTLLTTNAWGIWAGWERPWADKWNSLFMLSPQALLEELTGEHVSVSELAMAADVSERTLRAAFEEVYGVGPARYLQVPNLHRIHRALRAADPDETSVSKVLLASGEWELGRIAGRYRRLFGELPSETLRAKR